MEKCYEQLFDKWTQLMGGFDVYGRSLCYRFYKCAAFASCTCCSTFAVAAMRAACVSATTSVHLTFVLTMRQPRLSSTACVLKGHPVQARPLHRCAALQLPARKQRCGGCAQVRPARAHSVSLPLHRAINCASAPAHAGMHEKSRWRTRRVSAGQQGTLAGRHGLACLGLPGLPARGACAAATCVSAASTRGSSDFE